ncbi:intermembrane transport protein PqiB [Marinomonas sp. M1K-6]|uniref:Intermembrane transport protein PqiB n=1 Tax=Marinomonas profundi TaxID=2726122 RepID=A0A847R6N5_9GAMM|nr:intermembrane transport protein PqiB [Marinomonas profundi]NLQ16757.1 intermembrane transport protein PqiB [Marinomonas profundi]UDV02491.1 intermembrane transport protein PqiB [Marinomonas profundi]
MADSTKQVEGMRKVRFNSIWLVPLIAVLVAGWMLYQNWSSQGPMITLVAANADGLEVGKTKLKSRNVDVGRVTDIRLSDDYESAIIRVRMNQGTDQMLREDAKFWVAKPRIGKEGVSGLGTLLSGAYIDMTPGVKGALKDNFTVLNQPPLSKENEGIRLVLSSKEGSTLDVGALVHFRGYEVGYVEKVAFDTDKGVITYAVVIRSPYDVLVNQGVQFWVTPGLSFKSSASGFEVRLDSLETFFAGGISFGLPPGRPAGALVADMAEFPLFSSKESAENNLYDEFIHYVFLFENNISGLMPGAAVEFRGVRIGTVLDVPFNGISMNTLTSLDTPLIPVRARIEPQRLNAADASDAMSLQKWNEFIQGRIDKGLRASLKIGNYLNAAKVINIDFMDNPSPVKWQEFEGYRIFPTAPDGLANIETKVGDLLDNLSQVPLRDTFEQLGQTMAEANETLRQLQLVSKSVNGLLNQTETQQLSAELVATMNDLSLTLETYQANGQIGGPLRENMVSLGRALNELQPLLRQLRESPNTLIFDSKPRLDVQPKAAQESP